MPGVRQVYPYVKSGNIGEIDLYIESFPEDSDPIDTGTPTAAIKTAVTDAIEPEKIPMTVFQINYLDVDVLDVDIDVVDISDVSLMPSIREEIESYLYEVRPYIAGADTLSEINKGYCYASIIQGIIINAGVTFTNSSGQLQYTSTNTSAGTFDWWWVQKVAV